MTDNDKCGCKTSDGSPCDLDAGWGTDNESGPCKLHGGASPGPPKGNTNAMTHGLTASPLNIISTLPTVDKEWIEALTEAYRQRADFDADDPRNERIQRACIHMWQSRNGEDHIMRQGMSEENEIGIDRDGNPVVKKEGHHLHKHVLERDKEARMILKDLGLLNPPEQQKADEIAGLADVFEEALNDDSDVIDV